MLPFWHSSLIFSLESLLKSCKSSANVLDCMRARIACCLGDRVESMGIEAGAPSLVKTLAQAFARFFGAFDISRWYLWGLGLGANVPYLAHSIALSSSAYLAGKRLALLLPYLANHFVLYTRFARRAFELALAK